MGVSVVASLCSVSAPGHAGISRRRPWGGPASVLSVSRVSDLDAAANGRTMRNDLAVLPSLFAVSMGLTAVLPTLPLYIEQRFAIDDVGVVGTWSGIVFACGPLAAAISGPFWGAMGDRIGRKPMVLRALVAIVVSMAIMPFAPSPGWLAFLRVLQGLGAGYVAPAMALGTEHASAEDQPRVLARLQVAMALGTLFGPQVPSLLLLWFPDRSVLFWFAAVMSLLAALPILWFAHEDRAALAARRQEPSRNLRSQVGDVLRNRTFRRLLVCVFLLRFGQNMTEPLVSLWIRQLGPLPFLVPELPPDATEQQIAEATARAVEWTIPQAFTVLAVMALVFAPQWSRLATRFGPLRSLAALAAGLGTCRLFAAALPTIEAYAVLRVLAAVFMAGSMTLAYSAVARRVEARQKALAFGWIQSCMQFGFAIGPMLGGVLAQGLGLRAVFVVTGVCLLSTAGFMLYVRRDDASVVAPLSKAPTEPPVADDRCAP
jgi:DHA1 family multidrug resistance protein-like MFS transporter